MHSDPLFDQEISRSILLAFDTDKRQPQSCIQLPALATHQLKDEMITSVQDLPTRISPWIAESYEQVFAPQAKRVTDFLRSPSRHAADKSPTAIVPIREPVQDWLTCLEQLFDVHVCHHAKQRGPCDLFRVEANQDDQQNCPDELWPSWDFFEPCPLIVAMVDGAPSYR